MEHLNALPAGTRLGEYEVVDVLGAGGFGITYRAWDTTLQKYVAVKEYLPRDFATRTNTRTVVPTSQADRADYEWGLTRFLDEARTLARFDHPHINKVHRFFEAHGTAYLVLDYIEGETLSTLLERQGRLSEDGLKGLLTDVLSGLAEVHAAGYVHRDLKPGNLMVKPDGNVVVLDFGAARQAVGQRSKSVTSILTPGYAPLEQYDTKAEDVGPWSDIYALGMVAYRCISGLSDGELPDAVTRSRSARKGSGDLEPAVSIGQGRYDARLLRAIDRAIQVEEDARPQSIAEWQQALPGLTLNESRATPPAGPSKEPRTETTAATSAFLRWAIVAGVIALIVAIGGGAYWLGQRGSGVPTEQAIAPVVPAQPQRPSPDSQANLPAQTPSKPVVAAPQVYPLVVETEPVGATVELLGVEESYQPGLELPVGRYQLEVQAEGYETQRVWVQHTERGEPHRVVLAAERQPFTIIAEPAEAGIRIMNIPERYAAGMALPAGEYEVEVSAEGYQTVTETVVHGAAPTERRVALVATRQPGEVFRDCPTCPQMVVVPAGSFQMGSPSHEEDRAGNEGPVHRVTIGQPFAVGVYEVTFAEWDTCATGGECNGYRPDDRGMGRGRRPVIDVNWQDAQAYAEWLSRETGKAYRLLSEAEWEYVARAGTTTRYSWGNEIGRNRANCEGCGSQWDNEQTAPVGSFRPNSFGLYDMHGNVWEWVWDCWHETYIGAPRDGRAWETEDCSRRVLRGGSWYFFPRYLRSAHRNWDTADSRNNNLGFRIARSLP